MLERTTSLLIPLYMLIVSSTFVNPALEDMSDTRLSQHMTYSSTSSVLATPTTFTAISVTRVSVSSPSNTPLLESTTDVNKTQASLEEGGSVPIAVIAGVLGALILTIALVLLTTLVIVAVVKSQRRDK